MKQVFLQRLSRICLAAVIVLICFTAWKKTILDTNRIPSRQMGDMSLNIMAAEKICAQRTYVPNFPYPPPVAVAACMWGSMNCWLGSIAWMLLVPASMIGCLFLSGSMSSGGEKTPSGIVFALAFAALWYFLMWDLRTLNVNSIYLLLILFGCVCHLRDRPVSAGILLGLSVALKVYSVALLPYFLLRKQYRLLAGVAAALVFSFVVIPGLFFGWQDAFSLTRDWVRAVATISEPDSVADYRAYNISPTWVVLVLTGTAAEGKYQLIAGSPTLIAWTTKIICLVWGLLIAGYFTHSFLKKPDPRHRSLIFLLDVSILLFCLFPASPILQPHHLLILLVPAISLLQILFRPSFPRHQRISAGLIVALGAVLTEFGPGYPLRGIGIFLTLVVYLIGIWVVRCRFLVVNDSTPSPVVISGVERMRDAA